MSHPFEDDDHIRHSLTGLIMKMANEAMNGMCYCGSKDFVVQQHVPTMPEGSTCDIYTCRDCGRSMEIAYSIVYSPCVLKQGEMLEEED